MSGLNSAAATRLSSPPTMDETPPSATSSGISSSNTLNDLAVQLLELITADGIAIALRDDSGFVCRGSAGQAPGLGAAIEPGVGYCGACIQQGRTIVEQEVSGELGSLVAVPLIAEAEVTGCVAAFAFRRQAFSDLEIEQLAAIASHLAKYRKGDTGERRVTVADTSKTLFTPGAEAAECPDPNVVGTLCVEPSEDQSAGEQELGTLSTIGIASLVVLLVLGLVSVVGYRRPSPAPANQAMAPVTQTQPATTPVPIPEPAATRPPSTPKPRANEITRPMVVENTGVTVRKPDSDLEPPPVVLQTATVTPDIPIVAASTPMLANSALPHVAAAGTFREPRLVRRVTPKFPDLAKSANMSGNVELEVTISERGDVTGIWVIRGPAVFVSPAMEAVKQWRYVPAQRSGKNVESKLHLEIRFNARK